MAVPSETTSIQACSQQPDASAAAVGPPIRPKIARAPLWARLPPLHSGGSSTALATPANGHSITPPPIVLPDRVGTTRVLLQDAQATMQKFAARMDIVSASIEQALKEVQLSRSSIDAAGEKTVADLADVVRNCQTSIARNIDSQHSSLDKLSDKMDRIINTNESMLKLFETHTASLNSIIQYLHNHSTVLQTLQEQQCRILTAVSPLEPLIKAIPMHYDATRNSQLANTLSTLGSTVEKAVLYGIEGFFSRNPIAGRDTHLSRPALEDARGHPTRGQKRRLGERDDRHEDGSISPSRRSSVAAAAHMRTLSRSVIQSNADAASPLVVRRRTSIWTPTHLQRRASVRRYSPSQGRQDEAKTVHLPAPLDEVQITPSKDVRPPTGIRRSSTRPLTELAHASRHVSLSIESLRTRSKAHKDIIGLPSTTRRPPACEALEENATPVRITRSSTATLKASGQQCSTGFLSAPTVPAAPECAPRPLDALQSRNGAQIEPIRLIDVPIEPKIVEASELATTEAVASAEVNSKNRKKTKSASKNTKSKAKGSRDKSKKGKKAPGTGPPDQGSTGTFCADVIADGVKEQSPKRQKTGESDSTEISAASEHGPPNSPLRPSKSANGIPLSRLSPGANWTAVNQLKESSVRNGHKGTTAVTIVSPVTQALRCLIDLRSSPSCPEEEDNSAVSLAAALAHVSTDVNFMNSNIRDTTPLARPNPVLGDELPTKHGLGLNLPGRLPTSDPTFFTSSSGIRSGIVSRPQSGRSKRYLVEDDSTAIDLFFDDDLLDE